MQDRPKIENPYRQKDRLIYPRTSMHAISVCQAMLVIANDRYTGRPKKNGDKIWTDVFHSSLLSIRFQDKLSISLENIGHNSHFEYN